MRQKVVWFILGVLVGSLFVVYASPVGTQTNSVLPEFSARTFTNYSVQGPISWNPNVISTKRVPQHILKQVLTYNPSLNRTRYLVTLLKGSTNYSIFVANNRTLYVAWNSKGLVNVGHVRFKFIGTNVTYHSRYLGSIFGKHVTVITTLRVSKWKAVEPKGVDNLYIVTASKTYTWYTSVHGKTSTWSKTTAKGKFYVVYGSAVVGIEDMSSESHPWAVISCYFHHGQSGAGTVVGGVYADAAYMFWDFLSPIAAHWDAHVRVYVDAWTHIDGNSWGNKWTGLPKC